MTPKPPNSFLRELLPKAIVLIIIVVLLAVLEKCGVIHRW